MNQPSAKRNTVSETYGRKVLSEWQGNHLSDACGAAINLGMLHSSGVLGYERSKEILRQGLSDRGVDEIHWSTVNDAYQIGRCSVINPTEARKRFFPVAANDNKKPTTGFAAFAEMIKNKAAEAKVGLPVIDPRDWQGRPIPQREWFVEGFVPSRTVTNLTGDGGSGKTELMLQLIAASSLGIPWFGLPVATGPCLYYGAEDEGDELHRRLAKIVEHEGRQLSDLDGVRLIPMAERDAVLAEPDKAGKLAETLLFKKLLTEVERYKPKLVVIDPAADVFGGDEINRGQVRKFVSMLRTMAIEQDCAVLLLSHPSLSGIVSGTGSSGSTGWRNSVRSRLYLVVPTIHNKPDPDVRILTVQKANYGRVGEELRVRWDDGVYVLDRGTDPVVQGLLDSSIDKLFLELLRLFRDQGQNVGAVPGTSYAPAKMAKHPKGKSYGKDQFAVAMQRLLDKNEIEIVTEGSASRKRSRLCEVKSLPA